MNFTLNPAMAASSEENQIKEILEKPLILGASVSADYHTTSPGKRLALRYTDKANIQTMARNGRSGRETLSLLTEKKLEDRSAIIGIDLFFWDSFQESPRESLRAMENLFRQAKRRQIPLVLGEIPEAVPFMQKSASALNAKMRELCQDFKKCKILPLNHLLGKILEDGYLEHGGVKHTLEALIPDGLHIGTPASEFLAEEILKLFKAPS